MAESDTDNLKSVPVDLKRLSDVVDNDFATELYMMNWLKKLMPLKLVNFLKNKIMITYIRLMVKYLVLLAWLLLPLLLLLKIQYPPLMIYNKKQKTRIYILP